MITGLPVLYILYNQCSSSVFLFHHTPVVAGTPSHGPHYYPPTPLSRHPYVLCTGIRYWPVDMGCDAGATRCELSEIDIICGTLKAAFCSQPVETRSSEFHPGEARNTTQPYRILVNKYFVARLCFFFLSLFFFFSFLFEVAMPVPLSVPDFSLRDRSRRSRSGEKLRMSCSRYRGTSCVEVRCSSGTDG